MAISRCSVNINSIQRELKEHGTSLFPIGFYHDYLPTDVIPWHWHEQLEFAYVAKGQLMLGVNTDKIKIHEGEIFFVNKEMLHSCWCEEGDTCVMHSMVLKAELLGSGDSVFWKNYLQPLVDNEKIPYYIFKGKEAWHQEILKLNRHIWESAANEEYGFEFHIRNDLSNIFLLMIKHISKQFRDNTEKSMRTERRMKSMLQYIAENYANELRVEDIADSAMISESECLRCFHDSVGISPVKYIKQLRMQTAVELLTETDRAINDIAEQCGFQDMSYFTKSFREAKGMTPSEYRKAGSQSMHS